MRPDRIVIAPLGTGAVVSPRRYGAWALVECGGHHVVLVDIGSGITQRLVEPVSTVSSPSVKISSRSMLSTDISTDAGHRSGSDAAIHRITTGPGNCGHVFAGADLTALVQDELTIDHLQFGRCDELPVGNADTVERAIKVLCPEVQKTV